MMKHTFKRAFLISSLLVFSSLMLTGCFELTYKDLDEYYDTFNGEVYLYYANDEGTSSSQTTVSLDELFSDESVNDVHSVETIDEKYYEYLFIQPSIGITVRDIALFIQGTKTARFEARIYLEKSLPLATSIRAFNSKTKDDDEKDIIFGDDYSDPICVCDTTAKENVWQSVYADSWKVDGRDKKSVDVGITDYIVVQFLNNTGYGKDEGFEPVKFSIVNLIVSPLNEKYSGDKD